ncbi:hypothetical protein FS837_001160 [Tulasnella sp. UAMH 9824]|nr:hypothetical protein FS837_001160 [Tulasnella sp. UAMH 9824]
MADSTQGASGYHEVIAAIKVFSEEKLVSWLEVMSLIGETQQALAISKQFNSWLQDGTIASGSWDKTIRLWDAKTGAPVGEPLKGHDSAINSVAFSQDGKLLASGSDDKTIRLWDAKTGAPVGEPLRGHNDHVNQVAFSPDGKLLVSGSWDQTICLWDVKTGAPVGGPLQGHFSQVHNVALALNGNLISQQDHNSSNVSLSHMGVVTHNLLALAVDSLNRSLHSSRQITLSFEGHLTM